MTPVSVEEALREAVEPLRLEVPAAQIQKRARQRKHRQRRLIAAPLIVVVAAAALALQLVLPRAPASAAEALNAAASAAEHQPWNPPSPGQYWYTESRGFMEEGQSVESLRVAHHHPRIGETTFTSPYYTGFVTYTGESWVALDGSYRAVHHFDPTPVFFTAHDEELWIADGRPPMEQEEEVITGGPGPGYPFGSGALTLQQVLDLPMDEAALQSKLREAARSAGPSPAQETWAIFKDLAPAPLSPEARAALFRAVAANVPDISYLGPVTDPTGRSGVGVAWVGDGTRDEVIFDPDTGALLSEQTVITKVNPDWPIPLGTVVNYKVILTSGTVDALGERLP